MKVLRQLGLRALRTLVITYLVSYCISTLRFRNLIILFKNFKHSNSQIFQDLMIIATISEVEKLNDFYFVEFGATNGIALSNSYLFEQKFSANGIVAEPGRIWQKDLISNRKCMISSDCVWESTGEVLEFVEAVNPDLSGLVGYENSKQDTNSATKYNVKTISLFDLLQEYDAPSSIDFLSIDTEGSEFKILNSFDFQKYKFGTIVCEHNYGRNRKRIKQLLESNGYKRKHQVASFFDDWYYLDSKQQG